MYNPDILITSKEEEMELPQSPVFYEDDYPWKTFKSDRGTRDPSPDWLQPSTTAGHESKPIVPKFCPFRKKIYAMASNSEHNFNTYLSKAEYFEEEFQPCLREQCAVWNEWMGTCTY